MDADSVSAVQAISAVVSAVTTIILACLTGWYVRLTGKMVAAMREVREPSVELDVEIDDNRLLLVVANRGASAASRVHMNVTSPIPWLEANGTRLTLLPAFRDGLDYLAPARVLKFDAGHVDWQQMTDTESALSVAVSFTNGSGTTFRRAVAINVRQYQGVSVTSFATPLESIAESLRDMTRREFMADIDRQQMTAASRSR